MAWTDGVRIDRNVAKKYVDDRNGEGLSYMDSYWQRLFGKGMHLTENQMDEAFYELGQELKKKGLVKVNGWEVSLNSALADRLGVRR